jgi:hypothetical protein
MVLPSGVSGYISGCPEYPDIKPVSGHKTGVSGSSRVEFLDKDKIEFL